MAEEVTREDETQEASQAKAGLLDNKLVLLGIIVVLQALMALAIVQFVIAPRLAGADPAVESATENAAAGDRTGAPDELECLLADQLGNKRITVLKLVAEIHCSLLPAGGVRGPTPKERRKKAGHESRGCWGMPVSALPTAPPLRGRSTVW